MKPSNNSFEPVVTLGGLADAPVDRDRLSQALESANIPTLVGVLAHLEGTQWLREPYLPTRTKGLSDHATGDLDPQAQAEIRMAALDLTMRFAQHPSWSAREIDTAELTRIMSACMGEPVGENYAQMMAEEMGLSPRFSPEAFADLADKDDYDVVIIGAGTSGICLAVQLKQAGIPFTILEKNPDIGGTWFENRYPDCGVDTPSYWYSYSFAPSNWNRYYSKQQDVHAYLSRTVDRFRLREHIQTGVTVDSAVYDEDRGRWTVAGTGPGGATVEVDARFLVSAVGQLNQPKVPTIAGQNEFRGDQFHSARWPAGFDISGRRVAVIGTGASAMQLVPAIADKVAAMTVFQRSPQWVAPNDEYSRAVTDDIRYLMEHVPFYAAWYRMRQAWVFGDKVYDSLIRDQDWPSDALSINSVNEGHRKYFTSYFKRQLDGRPDLIEKSLPTYPPFGKRMLLDNGWFTALRRPNVTLETGAVTRITDDAVVTEDGTRYEVDTIVYATGFDSLNLLGSLEVKGRGGVVLRDQWGANDARAYLGMTEHMFPNMFMLYGPNTNLGHGGSLLYITECHVRYIMSLIAQMAAVGAKTVECRREVRDSYNQQVDRAHERLIWTHPGMDTWYRNEHGRVVTNAPWRLIDIWNQTTGADLDDYELGQVSADHAVATEVAS